MILHDYFRSSAAFRVRIALNLKGVRAERRFVHLRKGEQRAPGYLEVNAQGFVPSLVVGTEAITQSLAIIEYLEQTVPKPALLPADPLERARVRAVALAIACDIHPLNNLRVLNYLKDALEVGEEARNTWYRHWIAEGFHAIERQLASRVTGRLCFGDSPTLADVCLVPQVANSQRLDMSLEPWPRIKAVNEACLAIEAFAAAQPARQPDAE